MVSQRGSSYALAMVLVGTALLATAYADGEAYDIVSKSPPQGGAGPGGIAITTKFDDSNYFLSKGLIGRVAFLSRTDGRSGLSLWYGNTKISHGLDVDTDYSEQIKEQITSVTIYFTESIGSTPGAFTSFLFATKSGKQYQFGTYNGKAKAATFNAPYEGFLGAVAGTASGDRLANVQLIWAKPQKVIAYVTVAGSTNMIGARSRNGTKSFDDTNTALKQGRISKIGYILDPSFAALSVTYGQYVLGHGANKWINGTLAVPVTAQIARIKGTYTQGQYGYFASFTFMGTNGFQVTIGKPYEGEGAKTFDAIAPKGAYLGAFKGWATSISVHQIAFVWFTTNAR